MPQQQPYHSPPMNPETASSTASPNGDPKGPLNPAAAGNTDSVLPLHATGEVTHNYQCDGPAPGNLWFRWNYGSEIAAHNQDPRVQIVSYNEDTYVLRQNLCVHWEAPFTYLLFGNRSALLIDSGATAEADWYPLRKTVDAILTRWMSIRRKRVPLTIVFTSSEDIAQNRGVKQFANRPDTRIMPAAKEAWKAFSQMGSDGTGVLDLGDRIVDVIATPGTHRDGLSFYDRYTHLLFTGDLLYPGKIQIANEADYIASLERLQQWKSKHPVKWVMGGHIEMQFVPGKAYPRFATHKPYEHLLQLEPAQIDEALEHARIIRGKQMVLVRPEFWLMNRVSPDQRTSVFPENVPNINPPRPF